MAVGANTYGTVARVEARVGDLVTSRTFATGTTPTLVQVETILDDVAARLNATLRANGYTVPVVNSGADVEAFEWLRGANSAGAAAIVLNTVPGESLDPDTPDPIRVRRQGLWAEFAACEKAIREGWFPASRGVTATVPKAFAGSQADHETAEEKTPVFRRALDDYPGVWSLTED